MSIAMVGFVRGFAVGTGSGLGVDVGSGVLTSLGQLLIANAALVASTTNRIMNNKRSKIVPPILIYSSPCRGSVPAPG